MHGDDLTRRDEHAKNTNKNGEEKKLMQRRGVAEKGFSYSFNVRAKRATTAGHTGHQALGLWPILRLLSSASCRCRPLERGVRPQQTHR